MRPLAEYFDVGEPKGDGVGAFATFVGAVMQRAEDAAMRDETTLSDGIDVVHERFAQGGWPSNPVEIMGHLRAELIEIQVAMRDADKRPDLRIHVVEEIGDAMLLLARLALHYGATSAVQPLALTLRKTNRRLGHWEELVPMMGLVDAWRVAKEREMHEGSGG